MTILDRISGWFDPAALKAGFVAAGCIATAVVAMAVVQQGDDEGLRRSLERQAALNRTLSDLQDAESSQRGFLLTEAAHLSQLYENATNRVRSDLTALEVALADEPAQLVWLVRLKALAGTRLTELAAGIAASNGGDRAAALAGLRPRDDGTRMVETARTYIDEIVAMEGSAIDRRRKRSQISGAATVLTTAGLFALMTVLALGALREARRREVLARYLPREVAALLADGAVSLRDGHHLHAAVVFVDMRGSTALAEQLAPQDFMRIVAEHRRRVSEAARLTGGMVDKFIGDGALVVFGLTDAPERASANALRFASYLLATTRQVGRSAVPSEPVAIGIGAHYGPLFCGVLGDAERQEFTVLGDTVNIASRLQDQCKPLEVALLVSGALLAAAGEVEAGWSRIGSLSLPGRVDPVMAFSMADRSPARPAPNLPVNSFRNVERDERSDRLS